MLNTSGGTPGYTWAWSNGDNTPTINTQPAGNYSVIVTDNNGCTATLDTVPPSISGPFDDFTPRKSKTWTWSSDDGTATFFISIDAGSRFANCSATIPSNATTTLTTTYTDSDGYWCIHLRSQDLAGNLSSGTHKSVAIIDNTAPTVTIASSSLGTVVIALGVILATLIAEASRASP